MAWPGYIRYIYVPPRSMTSAEDYESTDFRCRKLLGSIDLYYWSLTWVVHRVNDWSLGKPRVGYGFGESLLWLIGVETVADLVEAGLTNGALTARAHHRSGKIVGSFRPERIRQRGRNRYSVQPDSWASGGLPESQERKVPTFTGGDKLSSVQFKDEIECIPWTNVHNALANAFFLVEDRLRAEGIRWVGPPLFRTFDDGPELLEDATVREVNPRVLLLDLERERRERVAEIRMVLRNEGRKHRSQTSEPSALTTGEAVASISCMGDRFGTNELAKLAVVTRKTLHNQLTKGRKANDKLRRPPAPAVAGTGKRIALYCYSAIRPWLCLTWPSKTESCFPEDYGDAVRILATR